MYPETFEAQVTEDEIQKAGTTVADCPIALACKPHFPRNAIMYTGGLREFGRKAQTFRFRDISPLRA